MSGSKRTYRRGFTLIELMIALTILTIVIAVIYTTYATVVDSIQDTRDASQALRTRQFIQRSLAKNLGQASEGWSPGAAYRRYAPSGAQNASRTTVDRGVMKYPFMAERATMLNGPADELTFVSSSPMIGSAALPGAVKLCTYRVTEKESDKFSNEDPQMLLTISESLWVDPGLGNEQTFSSPEQARELIEKAGDRMELKPVNVSVPIYAWELAYYDGKDWVDVWDSQQVGRLPWAVRVRLKVTSPEGDAFANSLSLDPKEDPSVIEINVPVPAGEGVFDAPPDYVRPSDRTATL